MQYNGKETLMLGVYTQQILDVHGWSMAQSRSLSTADVSRRLFRF